MVSCVSSHGAGAGALCTTDMISGDSAPTNPVPYRARYNSCNTNRADCTESATVSVSFGDGRIGSPRSRLAALMQAVG
jgi:hypothetical protein